MKKLIKFRWWKLLIVIVLLIVGTLTYFFRPYQPESAALSAMKSNNQVTVSEQGKWIQFQPSTAAKKPSVIFYPGGLVNPQSYAPLAAKLAELGHATYIVKMPLNLAVLDGDRGNAILELNPEETFVIGGHSLGGVMASRFAVTHQDQIHGVFFLASYPDPKGSLSSTSISVLSLIGSKDGLVNQETFQTSKQYLPTSASIQTIEGGNHSQFGDYGFQKGDQAADIPAKKQLQTTAEHIKNWLDSMSKK